jgi:eukaryotic-like serine/threonine-protein kinase
LRSSICADGSKLELLAPLPADPAARAQIAALTRDVEDARTAERLGELERGLAIATRIAHAVDATGHAPLVAAHLLVLGKLQQRSTALEGAAQSLRRAVEVAARAGDAAVEAEALSQLLSQSGGTVQDQQRVDDLTLAARSAVARARSDAQLARLEVVLATIDQGQGRFAPARAHYERALAIWRDKLAADPTQYHLGAATHLNFGALLADLGDNAGARSAYERARTIWSSALGAEHPYIGDVELNLGVLEAVLGDHAASRAHHERARAIYERAYGPDHERVATALSNFGDASIQLGEPDRAFPALERALAIRRKLYGDQHLAVAASRCTIGIAEARNGRGGIPQLEQCLAIRSAGLPAGHPDIAQVHGYLGIAYEIAKQPDAAMRAYALAARLHAAAGQRQEEAQQENNLGLLYGRRGDHATAVVHLRRADAAWQVANKTHPLAIDTRFLLAQELWFAGDHRAARETATTARDAAPPDQRKVIDGWLAEHAR